MKYGKEIVEILCKHLKKGSSIKSACAASGIDKSTFYEWKKLKADFPDIIKKAMAIPDMKVENALYKSAIMGHSYTETEYKTVPKKDGTGLKKIPVKKVKKFIVPNVTAQIFWLKNRCPEEFKDKTEHEHTGVVSLILSDKFLPKSDKDDGNKSK